ncbi:MAG: hypothetical protein ACTSV2_13180 [Candidatus Thorarchaeota archaeon]
MMNTHIEGGFNTLITFEFPVGDLIAVIPYVLPLIFIASSFILYQRFLPQDDMKRNILWGSSIICYLSAFVLVLYTGFGFTFGSWWSFVGGVQGLSNIVFASTLTGTLYVIFIGVIVTLVAKFVIVPPDPDFIVLRDELHETKSQSTVLEENLKKIESENKQLHEFLSEREESLSNLQSELEGLKLSIGDSDTPLVEPKILAKEPVKPVKMDADEKRELLFSLSDKDKTISRLQSEIADLRLIMESVDAHPSSESSVSADIEEKIERLEQKLRASESVIDDFDRRSETASEVSDSVISDLAELISDIETSQLDETTRKTMAGLVANLGRAMGRVVTPHDTKDIPRVELIGAVMMVHEIVDTIKKIVRTS